MAAPTTLAIDPVAVQEQTSNNLATNNQSGTFDNILNTTSYAAGVFGPVAVESVYAASGSQPASIVSAAVNAAASPMGATTGLSAGAGYYGGGSLGSSGSTNYLTGGVTGGAYAADSGEASMTGNVEGILNQSYTNQAYLIAVQGEMGNIQTTTTSISNALNVKHSAMKSVINNFRVG